MDDLTRLLQEAVDRTRRIETRQAKYLTSIGFDAGVRRPLWADGAVEVPSPASSIVDVLSVVPDAWDKEDEIEVTYRGQLLGVVLKP